MAIRLVLLVVVAALGCATQRAVGTARTLPSDTPQVCASHCDSIGMRLAAVVIISNSEGCVCEPRDATPAAPRAGAAGAAGIAPILAAASAAAAAQKQQEDERRRRQESSPPKPWQPPIHH